MMLSFTEESETSVTRFGFVEHIFPRRGREGGGQREQGLVGETVKRQMKLGSLASPSPRLTSCSAAWFLTGHGPLRVRGSGTPPPHPGPRKNLTTTTKLLSPDEF